MVNESVYSMGPDIGEPGDHMGYPADYDFHQLHLIPAGAAGTRPGHYAQHRRQSGRDIGDLNGSKRFTGRYFPAVPDQRNVCIVRVC